MDMECWLRINPEFTVRFGYKNRMDYEFGYIAGNIVQQKRLLTNIRVDKRNRGELMRYTMEYSGTSAHAMSNYSNNKMYNRLIGISLEKEGNTLNPTRIIWEKKQKSRPQSLFGHVI